MIIKQLLSIWTIHLQGVWLCPAAEEGKLYVLKAHWTTDGKTNIEVSWRKDDIPRGTCALNKKCKMYLSEKYEADMSNVSEKMMVASLSILNVSKTDEGLWALEAIGLKHLDKPDIYNCSLKVIEKAKLILENCPTEVYAGTEIACVCQVSPLQNYSALWYSGQGVVHSNISNVLSFIAQDEGIATFTCRLKSSDAQYISYKLKIISRYRKWYS